MRRVSLQQVRIESPCAKSWEEMDGDEGKRFCEHCQKEVYNLAALSGREARRAVSERRCVRVTYASTGRVVTRGVVRLQRMAGWLNRPSMKWAYGLLLMAVPMLGTCGREGHSALAGTPSPATTQASRVEMGDVCVPPATAPATLGVPVAPKRTSEE